MTSLRCHEWDIHQSYRRDRNAPPWIKVHRHIMSNRKWARLTDAEKGQLVSIWILAADKDGHVPHDSFLLRKLCMLDDEPNISKFIDLGLLIPTGRQDDVNVTPERRQNDAPEAEPEADKEREKKERPRKRAPAKTRLAETSLPDDWRDYCQTKRPDLDPDETFNNFRDYWIGHGKPMADWRATWQRWVRNENTRPQSRNGTVRENSDERRTREANEHRQRILAGQT